MSNEQKTLGESIRDRLASRFQQKDESFGQWLRRRANAGVTHGIARPSKAGGEEGNQS